MPHHVYANGREIASKSAHGASLGAFDVCYSPPGDDTGTPVPYPNSCLARDLTNGSRTVFIQGMEIALEDYSYFAKSYGDEAATHQLKKGINSGTIQGRCYFISWSMNVKVEGRGVARHLDDVTHNHSNPANTPAVPYISKSGTKAVCERNREAVKKQCEPDQGNSSLFKKALGKQRYQALQNLLNKGGMSSDSWLGSHCDGLWIKPDVSSPHARQVVEDFASRIQDMEQQLTEFLPRQLEAIYDQLDDAIWERAGDALVELGQRKGRNASIRHGAALAGGLAGPVGVTVTEALAAIWTAADGIAGVVEGAMTAGELAGLLDDAQEAIERIPRTLQQALATAQSDPQRAMADFMEAAARLNACARARRCTLVRFRNTQGTKAPLTGNGCCPGQTGHHLIPSTMAKEGCSKYREESAPVICTEGTSHSLGGTHQALHTELKNATDRFVANGGNTMSYPQVRDMAVKTVRATFPESFCDAACLKAQLNDYYENKCKQPMSPNPGRGPVTPGVDTGPQAD